MDARGAMQPRSIGVGEAHVALLAFVTSDRRKKDSSSWSEGRLHARLLLLIAVEPPTNAINLTVNSCVAQVVRNFETEGEEIGEPF